MDLTLWIGSALAIAWFLWAGRPGERPSVARLGAALLLLAWIFAVTAFSFFDTQSTITGGDIAFHAAVVLGMTLPGILGLSIWRGGVALSLRWVQLVLLLSPLLFVTQVMFGLVGLVLVAPVWSQLRLRGRSLGLLRWVGAGFLIVTMAVIGSDATVFGASLLLAYVASLQRIAPRAAVEAEDPDAG